MWNLVLSLWSVFIGVGVSLQRQDNESKKTVVDRYHWWNCLLAILRVIFILVFKANHWWLHLFYQFQTLSLLATWTLIILLLHHTFVIKKIHSPVHKPHWKFLGALLFTLITLACEEVGRRYEWKWMQQIPPCLGFLWWFLVLLNLVRIVYVMHGYLNYSQNIKAKKLYWRLPWANLSLLFLGARYLFQTFWLEIWESWILDCLIFAAYAKIIQGSFAVEEHLRNSIAISRNSQQIILIDIETGKVISETKAKRGQKRISYISPQGGAITETTAQQIPASHLRRSILHRPPSVVEKVPELEPLTPPPLSDVNALSNFSLSDLSRDPSPHSTLSSRHHSPLSTVSLRDPSPLSTISLRDPSPTGLQWDSGYSKVLMIRGEVGPNIQRLINALKEQGDLEELSVSGSLSQVGEIKGLSAGRPTPGNTTPRGTTMVMPQIPESYAVPPSMESFEPLDIHMAPSLLGWPKTWTEVFAFPNPIQNSTARLHALCNTFLGIGLLVAISYKQHFLVWGLFTYHSYHFVGYFLSGPRFNVQSWVIHFLLQPLTKPFFDEERLTAGAPKRFGEFIHTVLMGIAFLSWTLRYSPTPVILTLVFLHSLEGIYDICFTCLGFYYLMQCKLLPSSDAWTWVFQPSEPS